MLKEYERKGIKSEMGWGTAEDVMTWWVGDQKKETDQIEWENIE